MFRKIFGRESDQVSDQLKMYHDEGPHHTPRASCIVCVAKWKNLSWSGALCLELKWPKRETDKPRPPSAQV
jgi:hypothetical protein